jgi:hypothetical protein
LAAVLLVLLLSAHALPVDVIDGNGPRKVGGSEGGGSLPKTVGPTSPSNPTGLHYSDIATPTPGLVLDAITRLPIAGATIVVTDALGQVVAVDATDSAGEFLVYLFDEPDLELAIPTEGVAGIDVAAGESLLILVP